MNLLDLIQNNKEDAMGAVAAMLSQKAFDVLDNYSLDEAVVKGSVKKDEKGNVVSFKSVPDKKPGVVPGSVKKDDKGNVLSFKTEETE